MRRWLWILPFALGVTAVPMLVTTAHADDKDDKSEKNEKVVKLEDIPAPARQGLLREAGGAPILKVEQETEKGKTLYEGHVQKGKDVIGIRVDANGKLVDKHSEKDEK